MSPRPSTLLALVVAWCGSFLASAVLAAAPTRVTDVRLWAGPEGTRLVLDLTAPARHEVFTLENPHRVVIDLANAELAMKQGLPAGQGPVKSVRSGPQPNRGLRIVLDLSSKLAMKSFVVGPDGSAGHRLVVELPAGAPAAAPASTSAPAPVAVAGKAADAPDPVKTLAVAAAKGRDLVVAIDAGHGGQDPGAIGRSGTREKDVTLAIARKLAAKINAEDGMRAVLIRDGDYFITLRGRSRKARELGADMFISVHADSVQNRGVSGSSVYVLSLRGATDEASRWLAERENAADLMGGVSLDDKSDVLASVLLDVTQKEAVSNSVEAADSVLASLRRVGSVHGTRVKHAGFMVLKSPDIPSMLIETAFISNANDERRLRDATEQDRIAQAIHSGVKNYFYDKPPPGTRVAALSAARRGGGNDGTQTLAER
ncbi:MAG TPA: N-acetylmuramoyl-L-alanine amidase [Casimicrobiaceae bacterium]|nr:N-acetylmuramoyl-L-alanine amidase [Casimicrobiaceae bacterium]